MAAYTVREVIEIIRFYTSTTDDLSGKNANNLISNKALVQQLNLALNRYSNHTKAVEGVYTFPCNTDNQIFYPPEDALRNETYRQIQAIYQNTIYALNVGNLKDATIMFPSNTISGLGRWVVPWGKILQFYPLIGTTYSTATLASEINKIATTIVVDDASNFQLNSGYITIGDEKISYQYRDDTTFYYCERGIQGTDPADHTNGETVKENNIRIWYNKLHFNIPVEDGDVIPLSVSNLLMEVPFEHIETICKYTAYNLLLAVRDPKAEIYKMDYQEWLNVIRAEVKIGRNAVTEYEQIRNPYLFETGSYLGYPV